MEDLIMRLPRRSQGGYSPSTFNEIFNTSSALLLLGQGPRPQMGFDENHKPTGEIISTKIDIYFSGLGVQEIKLPSTFKLPNSVNDLSEVTLIDPEACIVNNTQVYVRAKGVK